jgi:hypothetical protein
MKQQFKYRLQGEVSTFFDGPTTRWLVAYFLRNARQRGMQIHRITFGGARHGYDIGSVSIRPTHK